MSGTKVVRLGRGGGNAGPASALSAPPEPPALDPALELVVPSDRHPGDRSFLPAALAILETPPSRVAVALGVAIAALIVTAFVLSCLTHTTILAEAPGAVIATGGTKVIQSQAGGDIATILVRDGQQVNAGDVLITLDPTDARANQQLVAGKLADARGRGIRLRAELAAVSAGTLDPPPAIPWTDDIPTTVRTREAEVMRSDLSRLAAALSVLDGQRHAKETARDGFAASIVKQQALIATSTEHLKIHQTLAGIGVESQVKVLMDTLTLQREQVDLAALQTNLAEATAAIVTIEAERVKTRAVLLDDDQQALAESERQADDLTQQLVRADKRLTDMTLRAPVAGMVTASAVTTPGQVALPGEQLMQIVPDGASMQIQAYVLNTDIGYVHAGQPATIKVDTFPYTRYGVLHGTVVRVSDDAISGQQALLQQKNQSIAVTRGRLSATEAAQHTSDLVFPITVVPTETSVMVDGRAAPLLSGMSVVVEVETARQRLIAWLLYPLARGLHSAS